jgi:hypothetical protein
MLAPNWGARREGECVFYSAGHSLGKELERRLGEAGVPISPSRVAEPMQTTYEMRCTLPNAPQRHRLLLPMDDKQRQAYELRY